MTDASTWAALLRVHAALVPVLDRELLVQCELPLTWYDVLLELNSAPRRQLTMGQLGERVVVSRSRVSRVVMELEREGMVRRVPNDEDGRSVVAQLLDEGRVALRRAAPVYLRAVEREFTRHLGDDAAVVRRALDRVLAAR
jgi:DNA-binding MarR family transcriptional regulator